MQVPFPITTFQDPSGKPISNGRVLIRLNTDEMSPVGQIYASLYSKIALDVNGQVIGNPLFWQIADLEPSGSWYIYTVYSKIGQLAAGPNKIVF